MSCSSPRFRFAMALAIGALLGVAAVDGLRRMLLKKDTAAAEQSAPRAEQRVPPESLGASESTR